MDTVDSVSGNPPVDESVELSLTQDSDKERRNKVLYALAGRALWWLLAGMTVVMAAAAVAPGFVLSKLDPMSSTDLALSRRLIVFFSAVGIGFVTYGLHRYFLVARSLAKLPRGASINVSNTGLVITEPAMLGREMRFPWEVIKAVSLDPGLQPDGSNSSKRFPLGDRYLFDASDINEFDVAVLAAEPVVPNLAIIFEVPVIVRNKISELTDLSFGPRGRYSPVIAPEEEGDVHALLVKVDDTVAARNALLASGKLRALRIEDFATD